MMLRRLIWVGLVVAGVAGICVLAFASINLMNGKTGGPVQVVNAPKSLSGNIARPGIAS